MNGAKEGDMEGEWTYIGGMGESVVDYAIGNREAWEEIEKLEVGMRIESDHQPLMITAKGKQEGQEERRKGKKEKRRAMDWSEEGRQRYAERMKEWKMEAEGAEEIGKQIGNAVTEAVQWKEIKRKNGNWSRSW